MTWTPGNMQFKYMPWEPHINRDEILFCILTYLNTYPVHYPTKELLRKVRHEG